MKTNDYGLSLAGEAYVHFNFFYHFGYSIYKINHCNSYQTFLVIIGELMNLYTIDRAPVLSALWIDDELGGRALVQSAQLLSNFIHQVDPDVAPKYEVYNPRNITTPHLEWLRSNPANFAWVTRYMYYLWSNRGRPDIRPKRVLGHCHDWFANRAHMKMFAQWSSSPLATPFPNNATYEKLDFTGEENVVKAYRDLLSARWSTMEPTWEFGQRPNWYSDA